MHKPLQFHKKKSYKNGEEIPKTYLTYYDLLIAQNSMDTLIKNVKLAELNINIGDSFLEYSSFKDDLIEYKCLCCNKNYQQSFDEKLTE